jgi:hypothetical protein
MITAAQLKMLTTYDDAGLALTLEAQGNKNMLFQSAKFLGLTNGSEFCYAVTMLEVDKLVKAKVYLKFDPASKVVIASIV